MNKKKLNKIKGLAKDGLSLEMMIALYLDMVKTETSGEKAVDIIDISRAYNSYWFTGAKEKPKNDSN